MPASTLTPTRRQALSEVAQGAVDFATGYAGWEPRQGYRRSNVFDWLEAHGLIAIDLEAKPSGRVMKLVPVGLTPEGERALTESGEGGSL